MYLFSSVTDANFEAIHPAERSEQLEQCLAAHLGNPVEHQQAGADNTQTAFFCQLYPHWQHNLKQIDGKSKKARYLTQYLLFDVNVCRVVNISTFIGCNRTISMTLKFGCIS